MIAGRGRPTWAEVDLDALRSNVRTVAEVARPSQLCVVVKADAYGHGAVPVARAAVAAGADWLGVALVDEAAELRDAGVDVPILLLSEPDVGALADAVGLGVRVAVYHEETATALAEVAGAGPRVPVHVKVDTGMHRVGVAPDRLVGLAKAIAARDQLHLEGLWTHCAVADEPDHPFTDEQAARFRRAVADLRAAGLDPPMLHAANSAATITRADLRLDLVRCGIAVYGLDPGPALHAALDVRPVLSLRSRVSHVQVVPTGESASYGLRARFEGDTVVATVPIGYADGVPRRLSEVDGEVLLGGRRRRIAGSVTMDQLLVDCGAPGDESVALGDEVVLLGRQGDDVVTADEWADRLGTIGYEIVCGISARVPRRYVGGR